MRRVSIVWQRIVTPRPRGVGHHVRGWQDGRRRTVAGGTEGVAAGTLQAVANVLAATAVNRYRAVARRDTATALSGAEGAEGRQHSHQDQEDDQDGDGALEIVFGTYVPVQWEAQWSGPVGVWGLEADGTVMPGFPLPVSTPGVRGAPTLADLDDDGDLEILAGARVGHVFAWDVPTSFDPGLLPWPTGRHDLRRSAMYVWSGPDFSPSRKFAIPPAARQGETVTFNVRVDSTLPTTQSIRMTDTVPAGLAYVPGTLTATLGIVTATTDALQWSGVLSTTSTVDVTYQVIVTTAATQLISNTAFIEAGADGQLARTGYVIANGFSTYLPLILKSC